MGRRKQALHYSTVVEPAAVVLDEDARRRHGAEAVSTMARELQQRGQRAPVLVAGDGNGGGRVVVGTRRVMAARELGWERLQAIVLGPEFAAELRVVERLQREEVGPFDLVDTLERLKARCGWTQTHLGMAIGRTRDFVANILAIRNIRPEVRAYLQRADPDGALTPRHLRYVGRAAPGEQLATAQRIVEEGLSTKRLEAQHRRVRPMAVRTPVIRVRALRRTEGGHAPRSAKEWRKYYRQLSTDLRRITRQEHEETERAEQAIRRARERQRIIKREARQKRRTLQRELALARKHLERDQRSKG